MTNLDSWYILNYCTLISKQWKRIIKETIRLSLDFKTEFDDQRAELFKQSQFLDRIFSVNFKKRNCHVYQVLILMPNLVRVSFIRINEEEVDTIIYNLKQVLELVIKDSRLPNLDTSSMNNLTKLDLSNCFLDRGVSNIHTLQKLTSLNIASTNNSLDIEPIGLLTNLTFLNIADNNMRGNRIANYPGPEITQTMFSNLTKLTYLNMQFRKINAKGAGCLIQMKNLTHLDLRYNDIGIEGSVYLKNLWNLTFLDISGNNIKDGGAQIIGQLKNLKCLLAERNDIGYSGAESLSKIATLIILNLNYNPIGDQGVTSLLNMTQLRHLEIMYNPLISEEFRKILVSNNYEYIVL